MTRTNWDNRLISMFLFISRWFSLFFLTEGRVNSRSACAEWDDVEEEASTSVLFWALHLQISDSPTEKLGVGLLNF